MTGSGTLVPISSVPVLNSAYGVKAQLYLDFNGHTEATWGAYKNIVTPAFDQDGDATTFSAEELSAVRRIWETVAEDFAPLKINVTTVSPPTFADGAALRVVIGGDGHWYTGPELGGISLIRSYTDARYVNTAFVFARNDGNDPRVLGDLVSHEAGHAFGLEHQSRYDGQGRLLTEYEPGYVDGRAPIMGETYDGTRGLWWRGTSTSATTYQDDLAVLSNTANGFGYRPDDFGNTVATAKTLSLVGGAAATKGIISQADDADYFRFTTDLANVTVSVVTPAGINDLDAVVELRNFNGSYRLGLDDPSTSFSAGLTKTLAAGTYVVIVHNHGGYDDLGQYTLVVRAAGIAPAAPSGFTATAGSNSVMLHWNDVIGETGYRAERSTDGVTFATMVALGSGVTSYTDVNAAANTYRYRVIALNNAGGTASVSASVTVLPTVDDYGNTVMTATVLTFSNNQVALRGWIHLPSDVDYFRFTTEGGPVNLVLIAAEAASRAEAHVELRSQNGATLVATADGSATVDARINRILAAGTYTIVVEDAVASSYTIAAKRAAAPPTDLVQTDRSTTSVTIGWTDHSQSESGYAVQRSPNTLDPGSWQTIAITAADVTTYTNNGLTTNDRFCYRVYALGGSGIQSAFSNECYAQTQLSGATSFVALQLSSDSARMSWQGIPDSVDVNVERSEDGRNFASVNVIRTWYGGAIDPHLAAGTTYYYRVQAISGASRSPYSSISSVTMPSIGLPSKPTNLQVTGSILSWEYDGPSSAFFVIEQSSTDPNSPYSYFASVSFTEQGVFHVDIHENGGTAVQRGYYRVFARDVTVGDSVPSDVFYVA